MYARWARRDHVAAHEVGCEHSDALRKLACRHRSGIGFVLLPEEAEDSVERLVTIVERANPADGFAVDITGEFTAGRDFAAVSEENLQKGETQFGLPAGLVVLLLVFGTAVAAAIPLVMALVSIVAALGIVAVPDQIVELNLFVVNMLVAMRRAPSCSAARRSPSP